jgi:hypothetical protein
MCSNRHPFLLAVLGAAFVPLLLAIVAGAVEEITAPPKAGRYTVTIKSGGFDRVAHVHIPKA